MQTRPNEQPDKPLNTGPYMPSPDQYVSSLEHPVSTPVKTPPNVPHHHRPRPKWGQKSAWKTIRRSLLTFLLLVLILIVGYGAYIAASVAKISTQPFELSGLAADASGRVNVLVLGQGDPGHDGEGLTDTMMVLSLDTHDNRIAQISVPRDLRVDIPGYGSAKINAANADGGVTLAEQTVSNTLGIPINYYMNTDFTGLKNLVDAVGGIDVNVKDRLYDPEYPCDYDQYKVCGLDIEPGLQHMDGTKALEYARCRKGTCGNDFGRAARQQDVINLVRDKILKWNFLLDPSKLKPVISAIRDGIQTDMGSVQMAQFAYEWEKSKNNQPINLVFSTSPGGYLYDIPGSSDLAPLGGSFDQVQSKVQNIFSSN